MTGLEKICTWVPELYMWLDLNTEICKNDDLMVKTPDLRQKASVYESKKQLTVLRGAVDLTFEFSVWNTLLAIFPKYMITI